MCAQTVRLIGPPQRALAHRLIDAAPERTVIRLENERRSKEQSDKMWAMISDVARARPEGRCHVPDMWKALFMKACGHEVMFLQGLDGEPFPYGFRSSLLSKAQMSELIECIYAYGAEHGVRWSEPMQQEPA